MSLDVSIVERIIENGVLAILFYVVLTQTNKKLDKLTEAVSSLVAELKNP